MMLIYKKDDGVTLGLVPDDMGEIDYLYPYPVSSTRLDDNVDWKSMIYDLEKKELRKMNREELTEVNSYGRLLTIEERKINKLRPSKAEVESAKNTIEMLDMLKEVLYE